jgi:mRNA interferase MazF
MTTRTPDSDSWQKNDIVVVPFPYSDRMAEKTRPALVISGRRIKQHGVVWVAMVTSAANDPRDCDVPVPDLRRAGLPVPSVVRTAKIACIEPGRILRKAGTLSPAAARKVAAYIAQFLD